MLVSWQRGASRLLCRPLSLVTILSSRAKSGAMCSFARNTCESPQIHVKWTNSLECLRCFEVEESATIIIWIGIQSRAAFQHEWLLWKWLSWSGEGQQHFPHILNCISLSLTDKQRIYPPLECISAIWWVWNCLHLLGADEKAGENWFSVQ